MATYAYGTVLIKATGFSNATTNPLGGGEYEIGYTSWGDFTDALYSGGWRTLTKNLTVDIQGDVTTTGAKSVGSVITAGYSVTIQGRPGFTHTGSPATGARIINAEAAGGYACITFTPQGSGTFIIQDLELCRDPGSADATSKIFSMVNVTPPGGLKSDLIIRRCLLYSDQDGTTPLVGAIVGAADWTDLNSVLIENCVMFGVTGSGVMITGYSSDTTLVKVYHCTMIRQATDPGTASSYGLRHCLVKNSYVAYNGDGSTGFDYGNMGAGSVTNAGHDASGDVDSVSPATNLTSLSWPYNFMPVLGSALINAGTNAVSTGDIRGTTYTRSATPTIGAFEYGAGGASAVINKLAGPFGGPFRRLV